MCACIYLETVYPFSNIESCVIHIYTPTPPAKGDVRLRVIPLFVCAVHFLHREQMRLSCSKNLCERLLSNNKYCCISFEQTKRVEMKKKKQKSVTMLDVYYMMMRRRGGGGHKCMHNKLMFTKRLQMCDARNAFFLFGLCLFGSHHHHMCACSLLCINLL